MTDHLTQTKDNRRLTRGSSRWAKVLQQVSKSGHSVSWRGLGPMYFPVHFALKKQVPKIAFTGLPLLSVLCRHYTHCFSIIIFLYVVYISLQVRIWLSDWKHEWQPVLLSGLLFWLIDMAFSDRDHQNCISTCCYFWHSMFFHSYWGIHSRSVCFIVSDQTRELTTKRCWWLILYFLQKREP